MTIDQMMERITAVYPGPAWRLKVQGMRAQGADGERQIFAIYKNMERRGVFDKARKSRKKQPVLKEQQLTIWDFMNNGGNDNHGRNDPDSHGETVF